MGEFWSKVEPIQLGANHKPILMVVVDTEEEFDWAAPFSRAATSVGAMKYIARVQDIFDEYGIRPTYVVDYPVASQPDGFLPLKEFQDTGRADIGAHLHPWVNPPHEEDVSAWNSYACNLDTNLERAKIECLTETIEESFGRRPIAYKAGRYGADADTMIVLRDLGYQLDLSGCPSFDSREDGGPDFTKLSPEPAWLGHKGDLLEIPVSADCVGFARGLGTTLLGVARSSPFVKLRAQGILSRLKAVDQLMLSPEGYTPREHRLLTESLVRRNVRTFSWTFHSPSVMPGCTSYVTSERELESFLDSFRRYFDYFFGTLEGGTMTPLEFKEYVEANT